MALVVCLVALILVFLTSRTVRAEGRPSYVVYKADTPMTIDGRLDEPAWVGASDVGAFVFPWYEDGKKEQTVAKILWDDQNLYVVFICEDSHIWAEHTRRDSDVYDDDCVEVFTAPDSDRPDTYFN